MKPPVYAVAWTGWFSARADFFAITAQLIPQTALTPVGSLDACRRRLPGLPAGSTAGDNATGSDQVWEKTPSKSELLEPVIDKVSSWLSYRLRQTAAREAIDMITAALAPPGSNAA